MVSSQQALDHANNIQPLPRSALQQPEEKIVAINIDDCTFHEFPYTAMAPTFRLRPRYRLGRTWRVDAGIKPNFFTSRKGAFSKTSCSSIRERRSLALLSQAAFGWRIFGRNAALRCSETAARADEDGMTERMGEQPSEARQPKAANTRYGRLTVRRPTLRDWPCRPAGSIRVLPCADCGWNHAQRVSWGPMRRCIPPSGAGTWRETAVGQSENRDKPRFGCRVPSKVPGQRSGDAPADAGGSVRGCR